MALPLAITVVSVTSRLDNSSTPREHNLFKVKSTETEALENGAPIQLIITDPAAQGLFTEGDTYTMTFT